MKRERERMCESGKKMDKKECFGFLNMNEGDRKRKKQIKKEHLKYEKKRIERKKEKR